ncbi:MAG: S-layer homology domain-containing protein [Clostridia bacterium]|nr:S-layer homology domain-containing protein [Clostridia bacterium]
MKKVLSFIIALTIAAASASVVLSAAVERIVFSDVAENRWSALSIKYAVDNGYMNGVGNGKFDPAGPLTRGMVTTVLWRREGSPAPGTPSGFSDVPDGAWYSDAVAWAKETGVVNGMTETTFSPNGYITREQLATMLFRFSSSAPVSVPERADLDPFADDEKVSDWAEEPLEWAVESGLINGTDGNRLAPDGYATREQFAAIIERYDGSFKLKYRDPVLRSHYTEPEYPLVTNADFYVSTAGNDKNDGSFERPFATWGRAVEAVRSLDKAGRNGITVAFMAGRYGALDVTLTAEDSGTPECPIVYCKYGDGDVVFDNGYNFSADSFVPIDESEKAWFAGKAADKIKKTDMSSVIAPGTYDLSYYVFSDTGLCTVARYPNKYDDGTDNLMPASGYATDNNHIKILNSIFISRIKKYHTLEGFKLYGYLTTGWFQDTLSVGGFNEETNECYITDPEKARMGSLRAGEFYWPDHFSAALMNVTEELDARGEYYVDAATSIMYVYDPKGDYHIGIGDRMITMNRANNVTFRGLTFLNTKDYVIHGDYCHDITVDQCSFRCCGGMYAIVIDSHDTDRDLNFTLTRSDFDLMMDCCLRINGHSTSERIGYATHMNALIDNNSFTNYNLFLNEESAMYISHCDDVTISHNEFINGGRGAVFYGGSQKVTMEYNYCRNQMINAADGGVFCTWNDFYHRGNIVRYNIIEDVAYLGVGGFSLYLDDYSAGTSVYSNLFFNGSEMVIHNGRDNVMRDNILVNPDGKISGFSVTVQNDVYRPETLGQFSADDLSVVNNWNNVYAQYDANPALKANTMANWPEIFELTTDLEKWDDPSFVLARNETVVNNRFINVTGQIAVPTSEYVVKYSTIEGNVGYTLGENPFFVNPSRGDYRLKDGVDFPDIQFEKIGRY